MATEFEVIGAGVGATVYAICRRDSDGQAANQVAAAVEPLDLDAWAEYAIALVETPAGANHHYGAMPAWMYGTRWVVSYYLQAGASPATTDVLLGGEVLAAPHVGPEPISLEEARAHLRLDEPDAVQDQVILGLISAAREYCEDYQQRAYLSQTRTHTLDRFPWACRFAYSGAARGDGTHVVRLPYPPLISVESIIYFDEQGQQRTLDPEAYVVDAGSVPGRIAPALGKSWPATQRWRPGAVTITYQCGHASAEDVPRKVKQAMKLLISHWWENREAALVGSISKEFEFAVTAMLGPDRIVLEV